MELGHKSIKADVAFYLGASIRPENAPKTDMEYRSLREVTEQKNNLLEALVGIEHHQAAIIMSVRRIVGVCDEDSQTRQNAWDKFITLLDDYLAVANAAIAKATQE